MQTALRRELHREFAATTRASAGLFVSRRFHEAASMAAPETPFHPRFMSTAGSRISSVAQLSTLLATLLGLGVALFACAAAGDDEPFAASADPELTAVSASELRIATGSVNEAQRALEAPGGTLQATVTGGSSRKAEVAFDVLDAPAGAPASDDETRRQIGLTLRAKDACNVIYVMWRITPTPGIFVSVKHDPGKAHEAECLPTGCLGVRPRMTRELPGVAAGQPHTLRTELEGDVLRVLADGETVWEGSLPAEAQTFDGPVGVRSDNTAYTFELRAPSRTP